MFCSLVSTTHVPLCTTGTRKMYQISRTTDMVKISPSLKRRSLCLFPCIRCLSPSITIGDAIEFQHDNGESRFFELELQVQDQDIDQYGVVHNATYAVYCHQAREELCKMAGFNTYALAQTGNALALTDLSLKFIAPLKIGDRFVVKVGVCGSTATRLCIEHIILKLPNYEPILEAKATAVWLDKQYRPIRIPLQLKLNLSRFRCS